MEPETLKTILFSAFFGFRPERLEYFAKVHAALPHDIRMVAFNLSDTVEAPFDVINATGGLRPRIDAPYEWLESYIRALTPARAEEFLEHVRGEFEEGSAPYHGRLENLVIKIRAFESALENEAPAHVFLWNQFNIFHRIAVELLRQRGIGHTFFHDGLLPGSIALDFDGEMGNSWITREPERFQGVKITAEDIRRAEAFVDSLTGDEVNKRHTQREDIGVAEALEDSGLGSRPVVFFAGQNDWHGGIKPVGPETPRHSPLFNGSVEALEALDRLAGDVGFSVLYKPHPLTRERGLFLEADRFPNSLILNSTSLPACMEASKLVSTIASQTCYVALLAGHPVMMLGRNQICGKGLTYDVEKIEDIPMLIELAMRDPLAATRREELIRHVARLERCYLLDFGTMDHGFYRRGPETMARLIAASVTHSADEIIEMQIAGDITGP